MDLQAINKDIKREFEEEWESTSVEALLKTNKYPRTKEEFDCLEKFLPKKRPHTGSGMWTRPETHSL